MIKQLTNASQALHFAMMVVKRWQDNPQASEIEVVVREPKRSGKQNSLIHALFEQCAAKTGYKDYIWWKDELKSKIGLKSVHFDMFENPTIFIKGTSEYSKPKLALFVEKLQAHMMIEHKVEIDIKQVLEELK